MLPHDGTFVSDDLAEVLRIASDDAVAGPGGKASRDTAAPVAPKDPVPAGVQPGQIASMILASFAAMSKKKLRRLMVYSAIGHVGCMLLAFSCGSIEGIQYLLLYIFVTKTFVVVRLDSTSHHYALTSALFRNFGGILMNLLVHDF
jgi:hypothetical protein